MSLRWMLRGIRAGPLIIAPGIVGGPTSGIGRDASTLTPTSGAADRVLGALIARSHANLRIAKTPDG